MWKHTLPPFPKSFEAYVTTGSSDVLCKIATASHSQLQETLVRLNTSPMVVRSTSVVVLSVLIERRVLPLLAHRSGAANRPPAYRRASPDSTSAQTNETSTRKGAEGRSLGCALLGLDEAFDRAGCGALEVVEPHPGRGDLDAHHRIVERAHLLFELGICLPGIVRKRFEIFVANAGLLPELGGSPDEQEQAAGRRR